VKRLTPYQKRQRAGQKDWAAFQKYRVHYQHLATLFSGLSLAGGFVFVMGLVRGYNTIPEILAAYGITLFVGVMLSVREYFVVKSSWRWWRVWIKNS
jgi:hypothetical protein